MRNSCKIHTDFLATLVLLQKPTCGFAFRAFSIVLFEKPTCGFAFRAFSIVLFEKPTCGFAFCKIALTNLLFIQLSLWKT